jgi:hypothetical protein
MLVNEYRLEIQNGLYMVFKGIWQRIFLLFPSEELLKLYINFLYRFCVLFLEIFLQKKSRIDEHSAILDFGGYACYVISRVTQVFYPESNGPIP